MPSEYSSVSKHLILATLRDWTNLKKYGNLNIFRPEYISFSICQFLQYSYMFLQIHFPNIFTQVGMLTVPYLEDREVFSPQKICNSNKIRRNKSENRAKRCSFLSNKNSQISFKLQNLTKTGKSIYCVHILPSPVF